MGLRPSQEVTLAMDAKDTRLVKKRRGPRRYLILPLCLIMLNVINKVLLYKLQLIPNIYLRVLVILLLLVGGFSFVGFVLTPAVERSLDGLLRLVGKTSGWLGSIVLALIVSAVMYYAYLQVYVYGVEVVLPESWHNPAIEQADKPANWREELEALRQKAEELGAEEKK